ncbi:MAG: ATP-binding protein [bacterium]
MQKDFENIRNLTIGIVEFISPKEIKVSLEIDAPQSTSLNAGIPQLFPKVNGFVLIPNEAGALIGIITWIAVEYSPYPKRYGYKDFNLVDLPFPQRKISVIPLGLLKENDGNYEVARGVYSYPSVGDAVVIPNKEQLQAIVQNKDENARIKIGNSPMAANAPVYVNPDKVFGRHIAILGNTGSGKSCSVAGLIRWSMEAAIDEIKDKKPNARFIILDPNGEYGNAFDDLGPVKHYEVVLNTGDDSKCKKSSDEKEKRLNKNKLRVPYWMWNSLEWASISQASLKTQRPILKRALREIKYTSSETINDNNEKFKRFLTTFKIHILEYEKKGAGLSQFHECQNYGKFLVKAKESLETFIELTTDYENYKNNLITKIDRILEGQPNSKGYFNAFSLADVNCFLSLIKENESITGELLPYKGPDEDTPIFFKSEEFLRHIENLVTEPSSQYSMDYFLMRVKSLFSENRINSVINVESEEEVTLERWLNDYIGSEDNKPSITVIDLSLLPFEIVYLIVSVMARLIFESHQRYKRINNETLPTTLVIEEAHNFIKKYETESEEISSQKLCGQIFEKIAKEGRKFGLGLVISSQRPSELSQTVLSQCNTFLLHRIVNDKDQDMLKKLVPDTMGGILNELSVLPTRKALLLGWAAPIPVLIEMKELSPDHQPKSKDPDFWDVWVGKCGRKINWSDIVKEWQNKI